MAVYISLLRAINVGGTNLIRMAELRERLECSGFDAVATYIQSGNLVLTSRLRSPEAVSARVAKVISEGFGFRVPVITRTLGRWGEVFESNPFLSRSGVDQKHLAVAFLSGVPKSSSSEALSLRCAGDEEFRVQGEELYLHLPHGSARTKLDNKSIERTLGVEATGRNWRTIGKLLEMARASS